MDVVTDAEAIAVLELLPDDNGEALALVLAAFAEKRRAHRDLNAINRVRDWALAICQSRKIGVAA
jgi:hypothetical protein